jgi:hypothetical protein
MAKKKMDNAAEEKFALGWRITNQVKDKFTEFCDSINHGYEDDCSAALMIWRYLPAQIREWAVLEAKGVQQVDEKFWEFFRLGLESALEARQKNQQGKQGKR